jgi:hypothetical protein
MYKPWYLSRTLWVNACAALAFFVQAQFGYVVPVEWQGIALTAINIILRAITKHELSA